MRKKAFSEILLAWFDVAGRKHLPWQKNKSPYRVWVSEIMLQQTQVTTVIDYFQRFMKKFPTVHALAEASEDEVLHLWTGLGYYARARHLHRAAQRVVKEYHGKFPETAEALIALPGIGKSTAHAILSICFAQNTPILDGNVKRVLTRLHAVEGDPAKPLVNQQLWKIAETSMQGVKRTGDYTQAMMDLGAMICTRTRPQCLRCPFQKICVAHRLGCETNFPMKTPKPTKPTRSAYLLVCRQKKSILLLKRPSPGIWGGLWSLPEVETLEEIPLLLKQFGLTAKPPEVGGAFKHTFTHFHYFMTPVFLEQCKIQKSLLAPSEAQWYDGSQSIGLPQPIKQLLEELI